MHKLIARIARLAASKAAAFVYAVAVGVAGNLAFNFVQEHHHPIPEAVAPEQAAATLQARKTSPVRPERPRELTAAAAPIATAPILPDPPPVTLPDPDALPVPTLKPAALHEPALKPAALPEQALKPAVLPERALRPANPPVEARKPATLPAPEPAAFHPREETALAMHEPAAKPQAEIAAVAPASDTAAAAASEPFAAPALLPPLGPAVDVSPPPEPPSEPGKVIATSRPARDESAPPNQAATESAKQKSWELSDIWHPGRVVRKGLHWADDQLPVVGGADAQPRFPAVGPPPSAALPIPLLAPATRSNLSDNSSGLRPSSKPGPGSGGLY